MDKGYCQLFVYLLVNNSVQNAHALRIHLETISFSDEGSLPQVWDTVCPFHSFLLAFQLASGLHVLPMRLSCLNSLWVHSTPSTDARSCLALGHDWIILLFYTITLCTGIKCL